MNLAWIFIFLLMSFTHPLYSQQVTHTSLKGVWSYFYITPDSFSAEKLVSTEQRLTFQDSQRVILNIVAKEKDYIQNTTYQLRYSISLRDNVPYLTLFSTESKQVLGAYVRMIYPGSLEMAADPGFVSQKQLYKQRDFPINSTTNAVSTNSSRTR